MTSRYALSQAKNKEYDLKLNLNNLRMKIADSKSPLTLEDLARKAGFWSARSQSQKNKNGYSGGRGGSKRSGSRNRPKKGMNSGGASHRGGERSKKGLVKGRKNYQSQPSLLSGKASKSKKSKRASQKSHRAKSTLKTSGSRRAF